MGAFATAAAFTALAVARCFLVPRVGAGLDFALAFAVRARPLLNFLRRVSYDLVVIFFFALMRSASGTSGGAPTSAITGAVALTNAVWDFC